jgi:osmoprotectant transport system substrate-binding protein
MVTACSGGTPAPQQVVAGRPPVRVVSYDFTENQVLAQLYADALRRAGVPVRVQLGLGTREIVEPSLEQGHADLVIDYLGTALDFIEPGTPLAHGTTPVVRAALASRLGHRGIAVLAAASAEDQNGFAVTSDLARRKALTRLSDLVPLAGSLTFGGPPECASRRYCLQGLVGTYGLHFAAVRSLTTRSATAEALRSGEIDVGLLETTDARLAAGQFVLLRDDRALQPRENVVPLVRQAVLQAYGDRLRAPLDAISAHLTTADLVAANRAVEEQEQTPQAAAAALLETLARR